MLLVPSDRRQASTADNTVDSERDQQRMQVLTAEQVNRLLETSALPPLAREGERKGGRGKWRYTPPGDRNRFHALRHVLAKGGLRPNEALGLTWRDVEWDHNAVRVCRTLIRGFRRGVWKCEEPKTKTRRLVTLSTDTMEALRQHRDQQAADLATMTQTEQAWYRNHGFVFAGRNGEPLDIKNVTTRHFVPLLAAAGLPRIRVYDLRHTHATLLLSANVPVRVVSERLGHKNAKMTLDVYAHVLPGQQEEGSSGWRNISAR